MFKISYYFFKFRFFSNYLHGGQGFQLEYTTHDCGGNDSLICDAGIEDTFLPIFFPKLEFNNNSATDSQLRCYECTDKSDEPCEIERVCVPNIFYDTCLKTFGGD